MQNSSYTWFKLFSVKGIGPKTMHKIRSIVGSSPTNLSSLFNLPETELSRQFQLNSKALEGLRSLNDDRCYAEFELLKENEIEVVHLEHQNYPTRVLERLNDSAPPILFCKGHLSLLSVRSVSIVGSRNVSDSTSEFVKNVARDLTNSGFNIISGYAKGVDTIAHLSAIESEGTTTFVLSYGILEFTLKRDFRDLPWQKNILAVSQFHPKEKWQASNAMVRNKLVVSLSDAVVVAESGPEVDSEGKMSGTFDAGKNALKLGVPLFVLSPGFVPTGAIGNRELIKLGGIELNPDSAVDTILSYLSSAQNAQPAPKSQQELFG
jgi:DNA processing protein